MLKFPLFHKQFNLKKSYLKHICIQIILYRVIEKLQNPNLKKIVQNPK